MKIYIFVEGESDRIALYTLWTKWRESLRSKGWGVSAIPLDNKSKFFRDIGPRAAQKLMNQDDLVVGLPDLYPSSIYEATEYRHDDLQQLKDVQIACVRKSLESIYGLTRTRIDDALERFHPSAFKHDSELLLLAAKEQLRTYLGARRHFTNRWRHPVEDQNHTKPPKYVVQELFLTEKKIAYRDTIHASAILSKVPDIKTILYRNGNELQCPVFKELLDWIGKKTNTAAYE